MCLLSDYLINVLDDLGLTPIDKLQSIVALLKASPENFIEVSRNVQTFLLKF